MKMSLIRPQYAVTAFALNATHYLLKPFSQEQFNAALDRAVKKTEDQEFLSLACVDGMYRVCVTEGVRKRKAIYRNPHPAAKQQADHRL